ncbi:hypothetical protein D3C75_532790 [compost metagenome]
MVRADNKCPADSRVCHHLTAYLFHRSSHTGAVSIAVNANGMRGTADQPVNHQRVCREDVFRSLAGISDKVNVSTGKARLIQYIACCLKSHSQRILFLVVNTVAAFTAQSCQESADIYTFFVKMLYEKVIINLFTWMIDINILNTYSGHGSPPVKLME